MESLFNFLIKKPMAVIIVFVGILVPGILNLFVFANELFVKLDVLKLIILSISLSIPPYCVFLLTSIFSEWIKCGLLNKISEISLEKALLTPLIFNLLSTCLYIAYIIIFDLISVINHIKALLIFYTIYMIVTVLINFIITIINLQTEKQFKVDENSTLKEKISLKSNSDSHS